MVMKNINPPQILTPTQQPFNQSQNCAQPSQPHPISGEGGWKGRVEGRAKEKVLTDCFWNISTKASFTKAHDHKHTSQGLLQGLWRHPWKWVVLGAKISFTVTLPLSMTFSDSPIILSLTIILHLYPVFTVYSLCDFSQVYPLCWALVWKSVN